MTCSRHVTNVVDPSDTEVLRTINPRIPGFNRATRCSFSKHTRDFPVPAGPQTNTSSSRASITCTAVPRGRWVGTSSAERIQRLALHPIGGDLARDLLLHWSIQTQQARAPLLDLQQPVDRLQHGLGVF